jgi:hypothetical protein
MRKTHLISAACALATVAAVAGAATPVSASSKSSVLYNSTISPLPANLPSLGFQATQTAEFGNQIKLTKAGQLGTVVVTMSSWGCQTGAWTDDDCVTTPGATFPVDITLNLYHANTPGSTDPGAPILSKTKLFDIPYRPSTTAGCSNGGWGSSCQSGKAVNITFTLDHSVPQSLVYGIAFNTTTWGYNPVGTQPCDSTQAGCPYDSLNVALSTKLTTGGDPNPGKVFWNTETAYYYCDGGTAGVGVFRLDSPGTSPSDACWTVGSTPGVAPYYFPAVQFNG